MITITSLLLIPFLCQSFIIQRQIINGRRKEILNYPHYDNTRHTMSVNYDKYFLLKNEHLIFSSVNDDNTDDEYLSVEDEVLYILCQFLSTCTLDNLNRQGLGSLDSSLLLENAYLLSKGRIYEETISKIIQTEFTTSEDISKIEKLDSILRPFISNERKARARLKMNYILAGAASQRLDEAMQTLSDSDELDQELYAYVDSLIKKEIYRSGGNAIFVDNENISEDEKQQDELIKGIGKETLNVLKMIKRRLKAQISIKDRLDIKLLAILLNMKDPEERKKIMKSELNKVELLDSFYEFVQEGIDHLTANGGITREEPSNSNSIKVELSVGSIEKMKDILYDVNSFREFLKTGLQDSVFSTLADDYIDNK